jgi:glycosyltransferase involved in cell wall biosynthesis
MTRFSVIMTTFNRANTVPMAIESVLAQEAADFELIIVDDGSTDETARVLRSFTDPRVTVVRQTNAGLSAARNNGLAHASSDWVVFLDDDDEATPGWLAGLATLIDEHTGVACCGAHFRTPDGTRIDTIVPKAQGALLRDQTALILAGTFAARTELLRVIGGYDEQLNCSHQTELALRLIPAMLERGLYIQNTETPLVLIERRHPDDRRRSNPVTLYEGTRLILDKHVDSVSRDPHGRAVLNGVLGVSAARLGDWRQARSALLSSVRAEPLRARHWLRLAAACIAPVGRRVWRTEDDQQQVRTLQ